MPFVVLKFLAMELGFILVARFTTSLISEVRKQHRTLQQEKAEEQALQQAQALQALTPLPSSTSSPNLPPSAP